MAGMDQNLLAELIDAARKAGADAAEAVTAERRSLSISVREGELEEVEREESRDLGLRVFVDAAEAVAAVAQVLEGARSAARAAGKGPIQLCLMDPSLPGEVEVDLGFEYPVTPQIKGAIRSLGGVLEVQEI